MMAASTDSMQNINSALCEITTEKLTNTHLLTLQTVTKALRDEHFRAGVDREDLGNLYAVLSRLSVDGQRLTGKVESQDEESSSLCLKLTAECFRAHRNACVQCPRNQSWLRDLGSVKLSVEIVAKLLKISSRGSNDIYDALRCGIQFLGNIAVGNQHCKDDIWELGLPHIFWDLLQLPDEKSVSYTCMVIHTCLDEHKTEELAKDTQQIKLALKIMDLCRTLTDVDWTVFIATQHFLKSSELIRKMYTEMTNEERLTLLELILAQLGEEEKDCLIPLSVAQFLASCFTDHCRAVLTLSSESSDDQAALVVITVLDVLCEMTSDCKEFMALQHHPDLLRATVDILKEVHLLGKTGKNVFTAAHDFSLTRPEGADTHPALSFKAHLIRLIGNLCHGHAVNQNKVRELDGIALVLDNCSIDSNNPFISQWAVFAIRNILEHNLENQQLIQGLRTQGVADDTMLQEMGFRVEERDGSLLLRPIKKDP